MNNEQRIKWSARSKTKSVMPLKKAHIVSVASSSHQHNITPIQKSTMKHAPTSAIDELPTIHLPRTSSNTWQKSREAFVQLCTIPLSVYVDNPTVLMPTASPSMSRPSQKKRIRRKHMLRGMLLVFLVFVSIVGSIAAYSYHYYDANIHAPLKKFIHPVHRSVDEPALSSTSSYNVIMGRSWNILLMGSDNDGKYTFPDVLTQVMMIVHIDTVSGSVSMVSVPRDSWVHTPELGGMHKIDQAFFLGATKKNSFDDGVREARLTIEKDYGIPIDRYGWVGLSGFAKVIDTLGGVNIDVTHPIVDDSYPDDTGDGANPNDPYAVKRLSLAPGFQRLNGSQALEYVRSRHADLIGDIGRTQRQQQVLEALKQKLTVDKLLVDLPQLIKDLTGTVYTDLSEQELLAFANFGRTLSSTTIQHITLGPGVGVQDYGDFASVYDSSIGAKQDVVIPHCENIQPVINHVFNLGDKQSCNING